MECPDTRYQTLASKTGRVALYNKSYELVWGKMPISRRRRHKYQIKYLTGKDSVFSKKHQLNLKMEQETAKGVLPLLKRRLVPAVVQNSLSLLKIKNSVRMLKSYLISRLKCRICRQLCFI